MRCPLHITSSVVCAYGDIKWTPSSLGVLLIGRQHLQRFSAVTPGITLVHFEICPEKQSVLSIPPGCHWLASEPRQSLSSSSTDFLLGPVFKDAKISRQQLNGVGDVLLSVR